MELGGTDPAFAPMILDQAMQPHTVSICVRKGQSNMMSADQMPAAKTMACSVPNFVAKGGKLDAQPTDHNVVRADVTGSLLPNLVGTQLHMTIGEPAGTHMVGEAMMQEQRVGDCTAEAAP